MPTTSSTDAMQSPAASDLPRVIGFDLRCDGCNYNLFGLPGSGTCPECHTSIEQSLRGEYRLADASPAYLRALVRATAVLLAGTGSFMLYHVIEIIWWFTDASQRSVAYRLLQATSTCTQPLYFLGIWLLARHESVAMDQRQRGGLRRKLVRTLIVICFVLFLTRMAVQNTMIASVRPTQFGATAIYVPAMIASLSNVAASLVWAFLYPMMMLYIRRLARRLTNDQLARNAGIMAWLGPLLYVLGAAWAIGLARTNVSTELAQLPPLLELVLLFLLIRALRRDVRDLVLIRSPRAE